MNITKELAKFVYEQMAGYHSGGMADIPNNPTLHSLLTAHSKIMSGSNAMPKPEFAEFLIAVAEALNEPTP